MNAKPQSQLKEQIKKLDSISTAPAILKPLLDMMRLPSDQIKVEKVVEMISFDGSIAAQCLRLANSPLYGRRETETVRAAVMALGIDRVRSGYSAGQVGARSDCFLAAFAGLCSSHPTDGQENRISRS